METIRTKRHAKLVEAMIIARKRAGIRQADLARSIGKTQTFVTRFESGQRRLDVVEMLALCEILDFNPNKVIKQMLKVDNELWHTPRRRAKS